MKFDVLTFGSATYDIYVYSDEFHLKKTGEGLMLCEQYGSKIMVTDSVMTTGGGATNAAVCFERLGLQSGIIACVGRDHPGKLVRDKLTEEGVSLVHLQQTDKKPTSTSIILVAADGGRTALVHRAASNLLAWHRVQWDRLDASWLYVSSLGGDFTLLSKIVRLAQDKKIHLAFNPGGSELGQIAKLERYLPYVDVLVLNKQEALKLVKQKSNTVLDPQHCLVVGAKMMVVTDGKKGATVYQAHGKPLHQPAIKTKTKEETGAGDAFGSGFVAGQLRGLDVQTSLRLAAQNSASVVQHIGPKAGLLFWPEAMAKLTVS